MNNISATIDIRRSLLALTDQLSIEALNQVPDGFNNNIIWNIGHLVAVHQAICYKRSGQMTTVEEEYFKGFMKGTKPERFIEEDEVNRIKDLLISTMYLFNEDYERGAFDNYTTWITPYGVELKTIDDAIQFNLFHEGLHFGYVLVLHRLVK